MRPKSQAALFIIAAKAEALLNDHAPGLRRRHSRLDHHGGKQGSPRIGLPSAESELTRFHEGVLRRNQEASIEISRLKMMSAVSNFWVLATECGCRHTFDKASDRCAHRRSPRAHGSPALEGRDRHRAVRRRSVSAKSRAEPASVLALELHISKN
jgi:hypothetical protein